LDSPSEFDSSWGICSASTVTSSVSESSLSSVTISLNTRVECSVDSGTSKIATCLSDEIVVKTLLISSHSYGFLSPTVLTCCSWLSSNGNSIYVKTNKDPQILLLRNASSDAIWEWKFCAWKLPFAVSEPPLNISAFAIHPYTIIQIIWCSCLIHNKGIRIVISRRFEQSCNAKLRKLSRICAAYIKKFRIIMRKSITSI